MKRIFTVICTVVLISLSAQVYSQGFIPPAEGKAAVYFVRVTVMGGVMPFEFFSGDQFIGRIMGLSYMHYEAPAGENLFWGSSENKSFVKANLEAGKTYLILVNVKMGAWTARLDLEPIDETSKDFERVKSHVMDKGPMNITEESRSESQVKFEERGFIADILEKYEKKWSKDSKITKELTLDMAIPEEMLK